MSLTLLPVITPADVDRMRMVRNQVRQYMTRNTAEISVEEQTKWWSALDRSKTRCFLVYSGYRVAGYGIVHNDEHATWLTGAIVDALRGNGYGEALFKSLIKYAQACFTAPVMLEVRETNAVAYNLYVKLGFEIVSSQGVVSTDAAQDLALIHTMKLR